MKVSDKNGFTLLEIMVSLAIVSLVLVMALSAFNQARQGERNSRDLDLAVLFVRSLVAELRVDGHLDEGILAGCFEEPYNQFGYQSEVKSTGIDNLKELRVTIFKDGDPLFTTTTYAADRWQMAEDRRQKTEDRRQKTELREKGVEMRDELRIFSIFDWR